MVSVCDAALTVVGVPVMGIEIVVSLALTAVPAVKPGGRLPTVKSAGVMVEAYCSPAPDRL
jgi:hypothetical protein